MQVSPILVDTKDSYSNNSCKLFQLLIGYTCGFEPNTDFSRPLFKTHIACVEK